MLEVMQQPKTHVVSYGAECCEEEIFTFLIHAFVMFYRNLQSYNVFDSFERQSPFLPLPRLFRSL